MKKLWPLVIIILVIGTSMLIFIYTHTGTARAGTDEAALALHGDHHVQDSVKGCTFKTLFGEESSDSDFVYKTPEKVLAAIEKGLKWVSKAQHQNGGWGAGSHSRQNVMDPLAVNPDPATTAMVAMALLRNGNSLHEGDYSAQLNRALVFLMNTTEEFEDPQFLSNTNESGTQIQTKLGQYIDVVLTAQFFSDVIDEAANDPALEDRIRSCLYICVTKIQQTQDEDGSTRGSGWAGVLQSSFANNALEAAFAKGARVDTVALSKAREYQKSNYNAETGDVDVSRGAGVMLYSVSSSKRASAKEARKAKALIDKAKKDGVIEADEEVTAENLQEVGISEDQALKFSASYDIYQSAKNKAQQEDVMKGFGNNGGEEFLSYLQTGESMVINKDTEWKQWYDDMTGRLLKIQNNDGSWNGHHCITSPVFCTATCLLVLSINNDTEKLLALGED